MCQSASTSPEFFSCVRTRWLLHGLSGSCTKEMHEVRKLSVWYKIPIWFQNTVCPKTKDAFPKIQASAYNGYSRLHRPRLAWYLLKKIPRRKRRMEKWIYIFVQSLSWLFQLAYFVKCKRILLELNSYQLYPSSWREWILSLLVYVLHKMWNYAFDGREMYKKAWCTCKVVVLPCQAIAYLTFSSPPHHKTSCYLRYVVIHKKHNIGAKFNCSCW